MRLNAPVWQGEKNSGSSVSEENLAYTLCKREKKFLLLCFGSAGAGNKPKKVNSLRNSRQAIECLAEVPLIKEPHKILLNQASKKSSGFYYPLFYQYKYSKKRTGGTK